MIVALGIPEDEPLPFLTTAENNNGERNEQQANEDGQGEEGNEAAAPEVEAQAAAPQNSVGNPWLHRAQNLWRRV